ncbi:OmpA family protein [Endozoicomonadaceae bacterium StTr2]
MRTQWKGLVLIASIVFLTGCSSQPKNNWPACAAGGGVTWAAGGPWAALGGALIGGTACAFSEVDMIEQMERIHFAFDSDRLDETARERLDNLAAYLIKHPNKRVMLSGHTDSIGSASYNQRLSERRAMSAYMYLVNKGVAEKQMETQGFGEGSPVTENETDEGRAMNRRTEFSPVSE